MVLLCVGAELYNMYDFSVKNYNNKVIFISILGLKIYLMGYIITVQTDICLLDIDLLHA